MVWPDDMISIILAVVFGAAIGLEREISGKPAGLRTNVLICLGAAVFTIISKEMAAGLENSPTRIAAQIVTGVGFLGAGAIIRDRGGIHGLTTAATIWIAACLGITCGAGQWMTALVAMLATLLVLIVGDPLERIIHRRYHRDADNGAPLSD